jgi:hypothetical protein
MTSILPSFSDNQRRGVIFQDQLPFVPPPYETKIGFLATIAALRRSLILGSSTCPPPLVDSVSSDEVYN